MKKFKLSFFLVVVALVTLCAFDVFAQSKEISVNETITTETTVFIKDITSDAKDILGVNGGSLSAKKEDVVLVDGDSVVIASIVINPQTITSQDIIDSTTISIEITFTNVEQDFTLKSFVLEGTPNQNASPSTSPSDSVDNPNTNTAVPSPPNTAIASPSNSTMPSAPVSVSPTATNPPTKAPPERTNDTYTPNYVTQAPPTLPPDVTLDPEDIATPMPSEEPLPTPGLSEKAIKTIKIFVIVIIILVLLLIIDIALIIYRKKMGYENIINNGVSKRKINNNFDETPIKYDKSDIDEELENNKE